MTRRRRARGERVDLTPAPVRTTRLAWQRTWLAYIGSLIMTMRSTCEREQDAAVFSLAATVAATGAMLLVRRVRRIGLAAQDRRRHTLRPRAVGLATSALLACALALPVLHALTLTGAAGRPHTQRPSAQRARRLEAAAPAGPPHPPALPVDIAPRAVRPSSTRRSRPSAASAVHPAGLRRPARANRRRYRSPWRSMRHRKRLARRHLHTGYRSSRAARTGEARHRLRGPRPCAPHRAVDDFTPGVTAADDREGAVRLRPSSTATSSGCDTRLDEGSHTVPGQRTSRSARPEPPTAHSSRGSAPA